MTGTLLEKAHNVSMLKDIDRSVKITPEEEELMNAWLGAEITSKQAYIALGLGSTSALYAWIAPRLRGAVRRGRVSLTKRKTRL